MSDNGTTAATANGAANTPASDSPAGGAMVGDTIEAISLRARMTVLGSIAYVCEQSGSDVSPLVFGTTDPGAGAVPGANAAQRTHGVVSSDEMGITARKLANMGDNLAGPRWIAHVSRAVRIFDARKKRDTTGPAHKYQQEAQRTAKRSGTRTIATTVDVNPARPLAILLQGNSYDPTKGTKGEKHPDADAGKPKTPEKEEKPPQTPAGEVVPAWSASADRFGDYARDAEATRTESVAGVASCWCCQTAAPADVMRPEVQAGRDPRAAIFRGRKVPLYSPDCGKIAPGFAHGLPSVFFQFARLNAETLGDKRPPSEWYAERKQKNGGQAFPKQKGSNPPRTAKKLQGPPRYRCQLCATFPTMIAAKIFWRFRAVHAFDPCAGWGSRAPGAMVAGIECTGCDCSPALREPFAKVLNCNRPALEESGAAMPRVYFRRCEDFAMAPGFPGSGCDFVFASPPWYDRRTREATA
eukprot:g3486.t1